MHLLKTTVFVLAVIASTISTNPIWATDLAVILNFSPVVDGFRRLAF